MPYSSMCPTVLAQGDEVFLVLGSPGSSRIISTVSQVIQLWVDTGMGIGKAVSAPRIHVTPASQRLFFESLKPPAEIRAAFLEDGFTVQEAPTVLALTGINPYFGGVHALAREGGAWCGAADPRRDGVVRCTDR
jgi:gamma-glutamyltranspeptidase/glutathione hydrolase